MGRVAAISRAKQDIIRTFGTAQQRVFLKNEVAAVLRAKKHDWKLPERFSLSKFIEYLVDKTPMREVVLESEAYDPIVRFAWGDVSPYELFLSIRRGAYLSHATAIHLHGLSDLIPTMIYVNSEQSPKPQGGSLTQEALNRAFANRQRVSRFVYSDGTATATFINGKNTQNLGVTEIGDPESGRVFPATDLERTLIDAAVRPVYAGGVSNVLDAYRGAKDTVSVNRLRAYLGKIGYLYPYHQSIGFFMERAGYPDRSLKRMRDLGMEHDFYLDYGLKKPDYDSGWRIFFPKGL